MFAQTEAAVVVGCVRRRNASLQLQAPTAVAAAVAACWHLMATPLSPIKLVKQWSVEGGALGKSIGLDTKDIDTPNGTVAFVKLDKNADWLLKAILGTANKGALRRATLFSTLTRRLHETVADPLSEWTPECAPASSSTSAVAEDERCDPMSQLVEISSESATPTKKRKSYTSKRGQNKITSVSMPEFEPTSHPDRKERRQVRLLALSTTSVWLCIEDIAWLVKWLSDELRSGGVPLESNDPVGALECNCEAEHVHIRWDFGGSWEAIILASDKKRLEDHVQRREV